MRKLLRRLDAYTLTALNPMRPQRRAADRRSPEREAVQARRVERARRRRMAAELAGYRTPAERMELSVILSQHSAEQVREIEDLLPRLTD